MASNHPRGFSTSAKFAGVVLFLSGALCFCGYQLCQLHFNARLNPPVENAPMQFLAHGKYESALAAAKSYYNAADLAKTKDAVKLMTVVLAKTRGEKTAEAFREGQLADRLTFPNSVAPAGGERVLRTIRIDPAVYDEPIKELRDKTQSSMSQIQCGNLLLSADRPVEARTCFELALQLAARWKNGNTREALLALDGIARSIRDEDGSALRADAFVLSMRARAILPTTAPSSSVMAMPDPVRAAAAELAPSGIYLGIHDLASYQSPEDPYAKAADDPSLARWLMEWQRTKGDGATLSDRRAELQQILKKTPLPCLALVGIGRVISVQTKDDWTEAAFYTAAIAHADKELAGFPVGANEARPIIDALNSIRSRLWAIVDGGDRTLVDSLYALNCDLVRWIPVNDGGLREARVHGFIGGAECLWAMGKIDDAVSAAESIDTTSMTPEEKRGVAWIRGLAFFSKGRFADAAVQFQAVTNDPNYKYAENASRFLIVSLARSARTDEANARFDDWVRRYHPNVEQAASVLGRMGITTQ
jgi:tetratricopeptide (TPR) repeat protein